MNPLTQKNGIGSHPATYEDLGWAKTKNFQLQGKQNKKEYAYNQSYARTSAVLPDMGQKEKERGESHEWALMFMMHV